MRHIRLFQIVCIVFFIVWSVFLNKSTFAFDTTKINKDPSDKVCVITDLKISGVRRVAMLWPTLLSWGDNIYFCCVDFNDSESPFAYVDSDRNEIISSRISIETPRANNTKLVAIQGTEGFSYSLHPKDDKVYADFLAPNYSPNIMNASQESTNRRLDDILPGGRLVTRVTKSRLPFPEDDKSWQEYRTLFKNSDEIDCYLIIEIIDFNTDGKYNEKQIYKQSIRIKKRSEWELRTLSRWNVCSKTFQEYANSVHFDPAEKQGIDLWNLRRLTNFSFDQYSHQEMTEEIWKEAEGLLQPCNVRDEITYGKSLISYYTEHDDEQALSKRNELVSWLMERPEPQRFFMIDKFYHISQFSTEQFRRRHVDLLDDIYRCYPTANLRRYISDKLGRSPQL